MTARKLKNQWYGNAPFDPQDRGSVPFLPTDAAVRKLAERNVGNAPGFYGIGEDAIMREAARLCELFNGSWSHHLNEADVKALTDGNRLYDFTHTWAQKDGWQPKKPKYIPTAQEVNIWSISGLGHDSINQSIVVESECKRIGVKWLCEKCRGEGELWPSRAIKKHRDAWKRTDPPKGRGWQLWETVSEGSPISPVFKTPEELAHWLVESPDYKWKSNDRGTTFDQWMAFLKVGYAPLTHRHKR